MKKSKRVGILLCCIVFALSITMKDVTYAKEGTDTSGVSNENYSELEDNLKETVEALHIPGMAVEIVNKDEVLFTGTYGNCDSVDIPFLIGSMSKSFTAACIMQLTEKGKIDLDQPITNYLDVTGILKYPEEGERITVRNLLNQTSGLDTYQRFGNAYITDSYGYHRYANINYGILGKIIENVSGQSYSDYVEEHIFAPLFMQHSSANYENCKADGLINGYRNYFGFTIAGAPDYPVEGSWSTVAAGYIDSSAADMGRYLQMYLRGGENVLQQSSIESMFYDNVAADSEGIYRYGMGWEQENHEGDICYSHGGLVENYMSYMIILPKEQVGIVILINANDYLVTDNMTGIITKNVVMAVKGEALTQPNPNAYLMKHLGIDIIYLSLLGIAILPIFIRNKKHKSERRFAGIFGNIFLHVVLPIGLLCIPLLIKTPLWVIYYFVKDAFFILIVSVVLLLLGGGIKLLRIRNKRKKEA